MCLCVSLCVCVCVCVVGSWPRCHRLCQYCFWLNQYIRYIQPQTLAGQQQVDAGKIENPYLTNSSKFQVVLLLKFLVYFFTFSVVLFSVITLHSFDSRRMRCLVKFYSRTWILLYIQLELEALLLPRFRAVFCEWFPW